MEMAWDPKKTDNCFIFGEHVLLGRELRESGKLQIDGNNSNQKLGSSNKNKTAANKCVFFTDFHFCESTR